jgi:hypothetical protein
MIRDTKAWELFEAEQIAASPADLTANLRVLDALYQQAVALGALPLKNRLEGLETVIQLAAAINRV